MAGKRVTVLARIKAKAGKEGKVRNELMALVDPTRSEAGCINYDLHQSRGDKTLFLFYENWVSTEDLDKHLEMPHLKSWRERSKDLLEEPTEITLWEMIS